MLLKRSLKLVLLINLYLLFSFIVSAGESCFEFSFQDNVLLNFKARKNLLTLNRLISGLLSKEYSKKYIIKIAGERTKKILFNPEKKEIVFSGNPTEVLLNKDEAEKLINNLIIDALKESDIKITKNSKKSLNWIAVAILRKYNRLLFDRNVPRESTFPVLHFVVQENIQLKIKEILNSNLYEGKGLGYELYSEVSEVALETTMSLKNSRKKLEAYVRNITKGADSYTSFRKHFCSGEMNENHFNKLMNKKAFNLSVNYFMPASCNFTRRQLDKIPKIILCDSFSEIPEKAESLENPIPKLKKIIFSLEQLCLYSCYFTKAPLSSIVKTLTDLKALLNKDEFDKQAIEKKLETNIAFFKEGIKKQKQLDELMQLVEMKTFKAAKNYKQYLNIINEYADKEKTSWTALNKYLDEYRQIK